MSRRTEIIDFLVSELKRINKTTDSRVGLLRSPYTYKSDVGENVFRRFKYLDEINDFPAITMSVVDEDREAIGADVHFGNLDLTLRGYVKSENALDACDDLADDMEFVIDGINHTATAASKEVVDCKVMSVETDQGLFEPFGIAMVDIEIIYQQDENT